MVDGVLAIDVAGNRHDGNDEESVSGQEISERKSEEPAGVQLLGIERQDNDDGKERDKAREDLPLGVAPVGLSFFALDHLIPIPVARLGFAVVKPASCHYARQSGLLSNRSPTSNIADRLWLLATYLKFRLRNAIKTGGLWTFKERRGRSIVDPAYRLRLANNLGK